MKNMAESKPGASGETSWSTPSVDVFTHATELLVRADLPGVEADDVHVSFHDGTLTLEGVRDTHTFRRRFRIEERLEADGIRAELDNGVLAIHLPKAPDTPPRAIPVSSG